MPTVKTAISLDEELFRRADRAARKQRLSRSRFIAQALEAHLSRQENRALLERINAAYGDGGVDEEDKLFLEAARKQMGQQLKDEPW